MSDDVAVNQTVNNESTEPTPEALVETPEPVMSAGAQLAALRQARGWKTEQIAHQLNLANRQVVALEEDNHAALPGMAIVRGFIRSYAKVLQADPTPILAAIVSDAAVATPVLPSQRRTLSTSFSEVKLPPSNGRDSSLKIVILVLILIVAGILIFGVQRMGWMPAEAETEAAKVETAVAVEPVVTEVDTQEAEALEAEPDANPAPAATDAVEVSSSETIASPEAVTVQKTAVTDAAVAPAQADKVATPVSINSKDALAIRVRQDAWVEIKRADNSVVLSRLLKAGSSEVIAITEPVSIVIGNAAGVDVTLRGQPIDVVAGNSSNVARLNLK